MRNVKIITAAILAILVVIIVVQNREPVATHLLFATVVMPHAVLLFITAGTGFALGVLLALSVSTKYKAHANPLNHTETWRHPPTT
jgi:uncharacterized integral membrane protein